MNLAQTVALYFGGPGSGCQGENCGRPPGSGSGPHTHGPQHSLKTIPSHELRRLKQTAHKELSDDIDKELDRRSRSHRMTAAIKGKNRKAA